MRTGVLLLLLMGVAASAVEGSDEGGAGCPTECPERYEEFMRGTPSPKLPVLLSQRAQQGCRVAATLSRCECVLTEHFIGSRAVHQCVASAKFCRGCYTKRMNELSRDAKVYRYALGPDGRKVVASAEEVNSSAPRSRDDALSTAVVGAGPIGLLTALQMKVMNHDMPVTLFERREVFDSEGNIMPVNARTQTIVLRVDVAKTMLAIPYPSSWERPSTDDLHSCIKALGGFRYVKDWWFDNMDIWEPTLLHSLLCLGGPGFDHPGLQLGATANTLGVVSIFALQDVMFKYAVAHGIDVRQQSEVTNVSIQRDRTGERHASRFRLDIQTYSDSRCRERSDTISQYFDIVLGAEGVGGPKEGKSVLKFIMDQQDKPMYVEDWKSSRGVYAATAVYLVPRSTRPDNRQGRDKAYFVFENAFFSRLNAEYTLANGKKVQYTQRVFRTPFSLDERYDQIYCGVGMQKEIYEQGYSTDPEGFMKRTIREALPSLEDFRDNEFVELPNDFRRTKTSFPISLEHAAGTPLFTDHRNRLVAAAVGDVSLEPLFILASGMNTGAQVALAAARVATDMARAAPRASIERNMEKMAQVFGLLAEKKQAGAAECLEDMRLSDFRRGADRKNHCHNPPVPRRSFFTEGLGTADDFPVYKKVPGVDDGTGKTYDTDTLIDGIVARFHELSKIEGPSEAWSHSYVVTGNRRRMSYAVAEGVITELRDVRRKSGHSLVDLGQYTEPFFAFIRDDKKPHAGMTETEWDQLPLFAKVLGKIANAQSEEGLRESVERYKRFFEESPLYCAFLDTLTLQ